MRLRELIQILEEGIIPHLHLKEQHNNNNNNKVAKVKILNPKEPSDAIIRLKELGLAKRKIKSIMSIHAIFNDRTSSVIVSKNEYNKYNELLTDIRNSCLAITELKNIVIEKHSEDTINIKLPEKLDLKSFSSYIKKINTAIEEIVYLKDINGEIKYSGVDSGSTWINVAVGGTTIVSLIGSIAWSAAVVRKKIHEGTLVKRKVEQLGIKTEALNKINEGLDKEIKALCIAETESIISNTEALNDVSSEEKQRIKHSIKLFAELIDEGTEVHHSLLAPESVDNLFPDYSKLNLIETRIKKISRNSN